MAVDDLIKINNLSNTNLSVGQKLLLKIPMVQTSSYTVKSGDSLYSIAKKFNTTVNEIKALNGLTTNLLSIGQTLILPQ